jgi:hypothetical protein
MTTFDAREREFEARFALEEELRFKVQVRRNRLVGQWAAPRLGLAGRAADDYAHQLVELIFAPKGQGSVLDRLAADFTAAGATVSPVELHAELDRCEREARRQIMTVG